MSEIKIGFRAVVGDEDLSVLIGAHGSRIDVQIGIEFLHCDTVAAFFEQQREACSGDSFSEAGNHASGHENMFGHDLCSKRLRNCVKR